MRVFDSHKSNADDSEEDPSSKRSKGGESYCSSSLSSSDGSHRTTHHHKHPGQPQESNPWHHQLSADQLPSPSRQDVLKRWKKVLDSLAKSKAKTNKNEHSSIPGGPRRGTRRPREKEEEYKSKWDQFCDFTSLVGFRLLHSRNSLYLRLVSGVVMLLSCGLIFLQTRVAINRFTRLASSTVANVIEMENEPIEQPGLLICVTNQPFSVQRSRGSVDFRNLVYAYLNREFSDPGEIQPLVEELMELSAIFNNSSGSSTSGNKQSNEAAPTHPPQINRTHNTSFQFFPQISDLLQSTQTAVRTNSTKSSSNSTSMSSHRSSTDTQFASYRLARTMAGDGCQTSPSSSPPLSNADGERRVRECRFAKAKQLFADFTADWRDYFRYVESQAILPEELIVRSSFIGNRSVEWSPHWSVDYGPCVHGVVKGRPRYGPEEVYTDAFDYVLIRTNAFEAHTDTGRVMAFLTSNSPSATDGQRSQVVNSLEMFAGKNLEISVRGASEIRYMECERSLAPGCIAENIDGRRDGSVLYTKSTCKWCAEAVREACTCNNPDSYLPLGKGRLVDKLADRRNCSLLEVLRCGYNQTDLYSKESCSDPCTTFEYNIGYAANRFSLETLAMGVEEMEIRFLSEYPRLMDSLVEFGPYGKSPVTGREWEHSPMLAYGGEYQIPSFFLEDTIGYKAMYHQSQNLSGNRGEMALSSSWASSMLALTELNETKFVRCATSGIVDPVLLETLHDRTNALATSFMKHFKLSSFYEWYPCPVSITAERCIQLLNATITPANTEELRRAEVFQELFGHHNYRDASVELAVTLNASSPNPLALIQYYSSKRNMVQLEKTISQLAEIADELKKVHAQLVAHSASHSPCFAEKIALIGELVTSPIVVAADENGTRTSMWLAQFKRFLASQSPLRLMDEFLKANLALLTIHYNSMTKQEVFYKDDYSFWEFLSEVGGILSLYFGLTIITVYEMIIFACIDREPHEGGRRPKERLFTRRNLYRKDRNARADQAIPTVFY